MNNKSDTAKKLSGGIVAIIILAVCLCITTFALISTMLRLENNSFQTGNVEINLNDGKPVIHENEFIFEPGMYVKKDFFIENKSTQSVYYKLYLDNILGGLSDVIEITIKDNDKELYCGTACELTKDNVLAASESLRIKEKKKLSITFFYPENKKNDTSNQSLTFSMCADATQTKNNPNMLFK